MSRKEIILILIIAGIAMILAVPYDLQISAALYDPTNLLGRFGQSFGELPGILAGALGCGALSLTRNRSSKNERLNLYLFGSLFILFSMMSGLIPYNYGFLPLWAGVILGISFIVISLLMLKKIPPALYPKLRSVAWIGFLTLVSVMITINMIKFGWSRVRYRDLIDSNLTYTPWYLPQGFTGNTKWTSFPSGHVGDAAVIFVFTLLPTVFVSLKKNRTLISILCYLWVILIMISRIIMGAHFLSDTIIGALMGIGQFLIIAHYFKKS